MTIEHEQCWRCGRDLKSAKSKADGYGSKCKKKMLEEKNAEQDDFLDAIDEHVTNGGSMTFKVADPIDEDDLIIFD